MAAPINQFSFSSGELSPQLWDRVDVDKYHSGAALLRNFFVDYRGGASNRPGLKYCLQCLDSTEVSRLIPFSFSTLQTYPLCFGMGPQYTGQVLSAAGDGSHQIVVQVTSTAGMMNGNRITISGTVTAHIGAPFQGTIDGNYPIEIVDGTHLTLVGSTFIYPIVNVGSYTVRTGRMRVFTNGAPVLNPAVSVTAVTNANPGVVTWADVIGTTTTSVDPVEGDWVYLSNIGGMPHLQNRFVVAKNVNSGAKTFQLYDLFGAPIDTTALGTYTGGGSGGVVYVLPVPYDPLDLAQLKFTQSADVMTLTHTLYQQADLTRTADNAWTYTPLNFAPSTPMVTTINWTHTNQGTGTAYGSTWYVYAVTAVVNNLEGEQFQVAVGPVYAMSQNVGSQNSLTWTAVANATQYNIYRSQENLNQTVPAGAMLGYVGTAGGLAFVDENISPDFSRAPPVGNNPFAGTDWPGATAYFQGRQAFAGTANEPTRLVLSKSGDYTNMDYSNPTAPGDSIDVTLESNQVNAIQHLVPLQVLLAFTSSTLWRIDTGDTAEAMTPSNVMSRPQNSDGCSNVPPIVIDYEILFVQNLQSTVRAVKYDFLMNLFRADNELTLYSNHLVFGHKIVEWAWAQQPFRVLWCVRDDGVLLSLTYLPNQNLQAWAQHDTQGQVLSICTVVEGGENAVYMVVRRYVNGQFVNYVERMASRIFNDITQAWFVDSGLQYPQTFPAATAYPSATEGASTIAAAANVVYGGTNYSTQTVATVIDAGATFNNAGGSGSTVTLTIVGGVITAASCTPGSGWIQPQIVVTDPTGAGSGAVLTAITQELVTVSASAAVFTPVTDVGTVMRINGGVGTVVSVQSTTQVTINLTQALSNIYPAAQGAWSYTQPVSAVSGLYHLEGQTVSILADGGVQPQQVVTNGTVTLSEPADAIVVGLPYTSEIQSLFIDIPGQEEPTVQGKRKKLSRVILRVANSRGLMVGPLGQTLYEVKDRTISTPMGQPQPLFTGDYLINLDPNFNEQAQLDMVQTDPLPVSVLGFMPWITLGDQ